MFVYPAMSFIMLWAINLKLGMRVGNRLPRFVGIFLKWPHQRLKVNQRSNCLRNALWLPNALMESKVMKGHLGSTWGQIAQQCPMATKCCRKNPWLECNALVRSKVRQGSTRAHIAYKCPKATKFGRKNPWSGCNAVLGQSNGVIWSQPTVTLLWLLNLENNWPKVLCIAGVMLCSGKKGSIRGQ